MGRWGWAGNLSGGRAMGWWGGTVGRPVCGVSGDYVPGVSLAGAAGRRRRLAAPARRVVPRVAQAAGLPAVLDNPAKPFEFPDPNAHPEWNHTGRRLTLANWLVSRENPLVARVFVNREIGRAHV